MVVVRPGQYVLACGLRTFAAAFPPLDDSEGPGGDVVVVCGEAGEVYRGEEEGATAGTAPGRTAGARGGAVGGGGGGDGLGRILNTSSLEVFKQSTQHVVPREGQADYSTRHA